MTTVLPMLSSHMRDPVLRDSLIVAIHKYVESARDFGVAPLHVFELIEKAILTGDPDHLLIVNDVDGQVNGFMHCEIYEQDRKTAVIQQGFVYPETPREIIEGAMVIFEDWAKRKGCTKGKFYTFRVPGAHRLMERRGWQHVLTQYVKDL